MHGFGLGKSLTELFYPLPLDKANSVSHEEVLLTWAFAPHGLTNTSRRKGSMVYWSKI